MGWGSVRLAGCLQQKQRSKGYSLVSVAGADDTDAVDVETAEPVEEMDAVLVAPDVDEIEESWA